jgi:hypothetical protein
MKRWRVIGQCAALAGAIVLVGGYVYVQAGGKLWPWHSQPVSDEQQPPIMSSSKLGVLRLPPGSLAGQSSQESPPAPPSEAPAETPPRSVIMAGSKSAAIFVPDTPPRQQQAVAPQQATRQDAALQPASPQP